jgi:hypothetical protein
VGQNLGAYAISPLATHLQGIQRRFVWQFWSQSLPALRNVTMRVLEMLSRPAGLVSGWTSAILCFSAATGFWLAGEHRRAIVWVVLGTAEVAAVVL